MIVMRRGSTAVRKVAGSLAFPGAEHNMTTYRTLSRFVHASSLFQQWKSHEKLPVTVQYTLRVSRERRREGEPMSFAHERIISNCIPWHQPATQFASESISLSPVCLCQCLSISICFCLCPSLAGWFCQFYDVLTFSLEKHRWSVTKKALTAHVMLNITLEMLSR